VALCDIDDFKSVNDTYGHAVGDRVLKAVGRLLKASIREQDLVARYGGEEFIAMLPDAPAATARGICERMRVAVEEHDWTPIAPGLRVTLSFGVSSDPNVKHHERLISVADELLYQAKAAGKNRVVDDAKLADLDGGIDVDHAWRRARVCRGNPLLEPHAARSRTSTARQRTESRHGPTWA
jgi:diguanylate cyclase (GGDEF)-like protein